jgi:phenylalanyl-tRNA synthetase beta chain
MSHWGVARDVCAYINHHEKKNITPLFPATTPLDKAGQSGSVQVTIENTKACPRYAGISIEGIKVEPSPAWLQKRLKAIGVRPINNIVDITNYIQHETGQPLHAFDLDAIDGKQVIIKNLPTGTPFITLDGVSRKLDQEDLMICNAKEAMCIAGVFGGLQSGVKESTRSLFIESAFFDGINIRKTSFRHGLRTDAATRFEKGTDIEATVRVLERAVQLIKEIAGGTIVGALIDCYPAPQPKKTVVVRWSMLHKLSGKQYSATTVKNILTSLEFEWRREDADSFEVAVPTHKTDISLQADIVEEIIRIDGLDNIEIPTQIKLSPAIDPEGWKATVKEKIANQLAGMGFQEMMTNSITNAAYYNNSEGLVTMINSLSAALNCLRPGMLETALEVVAHNLNHRNLNLRLFEFGKIYRRSGKDQFQELERCCLVITGQKNESSWKQTATAADFYTLKGAVDALIKGLGLKITSQEMESTESLSFGITWSDSKQTVGFGGEVSPKWLEKMGIKQPVFFAELNWDYLALQFNQQRSVIREIPRFPAVQRDLALIAPRSLTWEQIQSTVQKIRIESLQDIKLFDIFESDKLGVDKKSMAVNFTFQNMERTLTDKEIEGWMNKILTNLEKELGVNLRK